MDILTRIKNAEKTLGIETDDFHCKKCSKKIHSKQVLKDYCPSCYEEVKSWENFIKEEGIITVSLTRQECSDLMGILDRAVVTREQELIRRKVEKTFKQECKKFCEEEFNETIK